MLIDSEGFLWIGTDDGLSRFDGHKLLEIRGDNNELFGNAVYEIFEDSNADVWVSSLQGGVHKLNKKTRSLEQVVNLPYITDSGWLQYAEKIIQTSEREIMFGLNESIASYDLHNNQLTTLYTLPDEWLDVKWSSHFGHGFIVFPIPVFRFIRGQSTVV